MDVDPRAEDEARAAALREAEDLEARMRRLLATKEDPMHDGESTVQRRRRLEGEEPSPASDEAEAS